MLNLALEHVRGGRLPQAQAIYEQILAQLPDEGGALFGLAQVRKQLGDLTGAQRLLRHAIQLHPQAALLHRTLADVFYLQGQTDQAIGALRRAIDLDPADPTSYQNLAIALRTRGRLQAALEVCQRCIAAHPAATPAYVEAASLLLKLGDARQAADLSRRAIGLHPDHPIAPIILGTALIEQGNIPAARPFLQKAGVQDEQHPWAASARLLALLYDPSLTPAQIAQQHFDWGEAIEARTPAKRDHPNTRDPHRRLRVGYVSADLLTHAVSLFLLPILQHHDPAGFEIFAYANNSLEDAVTQQLRAACDHWRPLAGLNDQQADACITNDQIDILIDLSGHTGDNRLPLFARQPAPLQFTYLGYPATTGLARIAYRLTDALADPPGMTESLHRETLLRLPRTAWCFAPPGNSPPPAPTSPGASAGHITFGSFNALAKLNESWASTVSQLLHEMPGSKLALKSRHFAHPDTVAHIRALFAARQIQPERLLLLPHVPSHAEHLADYARIDIALDPFPYHGTTTTCEALWMGVPVVTLAGAAHVSRVGVSLLTHAGLGDLIASSPQEYVQIASSLAVDLPRLRLLRAELRPSLRASPLMNAPALAADIEAAWRAAWQSWCAR
jgi:predicted O-linked N-acetylglucosamine transferase (SPINDLY family)